MKRLVLAVTFACVLSVTALAGEIPTTGITSPAPGETQTPPAVTAQGDIPTPGVASQGDIPMPLSVLLTILDFAF